MYNIDQIIFAFFVVLFICVVVMLFGLFKNILSDNKNYVMMPPPPPIKWMIDIVPCKMGTGIEEYVVKRLDPKQDFTYYDVIAFFKTYEEAEVFIEKHFHFPVGFRSPPPAFPEPEQES